jgi:hypothetical protein
MVSDVVSLAVNWVGDSLKPVTSSGNKTHPDVGIIRLGGKDVPMLFGYWNAPISADDILSSEEGKTLRKLLDEFNLGSVQHRITPIVVYIPTKLEVYGEHFTQRSGGRFLSKIDTQLKFQRNKMEAVETLSHESGVRLINLLPYFKELADRGKLLYYPTDSHWNSDGAQAAAEYIAATMGWSCKASPRTSCDKVFGSSVPSGP